MLTVIVEGSSIHPVLIISQARLLSIIEELAGGCPDISPSDFFILGASNAVHPAELVLKLKMAICGMLLQELGAGSSAPGFTFRKA